MWMQIKNFGRRHKKKLIASGVLAAGGYCTYRFVLPWLRDRLVKQVEKALLQELAATQPAKGHTQKRFKHILKVSDAHALKALGPLKIRHHACFDIEALHVEVRTSPKKEKLEALKTLGAECLARLVSSIYTLHLLLLLQRVQFNIVGRELAKHASVQSSSDNGDDVQAHALFLEASGYLEKDGLSRVAASARASATKVMGKPEYLPTALVSAGTLEELLLSVCTETDKDLLSDPDDGSSFLPASLDPEDPDHNAKIKPFLDEARDYLESPQFRGVLAALSVSAVRTITGRLGDAAPDPAKAPLAEGRSCALAKLSGSFMELSDMVLVPENELGLVDQFTKEPLVTQLCEGLYFQGGSESDPAACPQQ